ncbi:MAG: DUF692 domain-containing protein [Gammaproteobacteria bacterium]|nr:DUF692 domain-containing protein [Gammaproteobacteria bacterium]
MLAPVHAEEAVRHVVERVVQVRDYLGRQILLENVSSDLGYAHSSMPEWEFLSAIATGADCLILLDLNNIFVSARNHDFDPMTYLNAIPADRVAQFHLAGHRDHGDYIVDTHDAAIIDPVWALYRAAVRRFGHAAAMIERDDEIPPLADLLAELEVARRYYAEARGRSYALRPGKQHRSTVVEYSRKNSANKSAVARQLMDIPMKKNAAFKPRFFHR